MILVGKKKKKGMKRFLLRCVFLLALAQRSNLRVPVPVAASVSTCCEGDVLLLLDSSGSVANYEFARLLLFAAELVRPFTLGRGSVRVGLLQVSTDPRLEFDLDAHADQASLQEALRRVAQMQGDTNTEAALKVARRVLGETPGNGPKVLLWLTDGVEPGPVEGPMSELKERGVSVLVVSTVHGNYQLLRRVATPPLESHLYAVDIDDISIITQDMREAIIEIIQAQRLRVTHLTPYTAVLRWRPVLSSAGDYYELRYGSGGLETRRALRFDSSSVELTDLRPDTTYTASLRPESNRVLFNRLAVNFTTLPEVLGPSVVSVSDLGPRQVRVSWGPPQPPHVQRYTVEYGAIPGGRVRALTLHGRTDSVLLTGLEPDTQYLVTISALHMNGKERAMSVRACTQEALPALWDLQLTSAEPREVQVAWSANREGLRGYWLSWERGKPPSSSSFYLPPTCQSARFSHLTASSQVCVSPIYSSGRGDGLCCTASNHS